MRGLICNEFNALESVIVGELPVPQPAAGETVLVLGAAGGCGACPGRTPGGRQAHR